MPALCDTSVLVPACHAELPQHVQARGWIAGQSGRQWYVAAHSIAETYSVLTRLPGRKRMSTMLSLQLITANILDRAEIVALSARDYHALPAQLAERNVRRGQVYDALIVQAAVQAGADCIVTYNLQHFRSLVGSLPIAVQGPQPEA